MENVLEAAQMATSELLPEKSRDKYERTHDIFEKWCQEKGVKTVKEEAPDDIYLLMKVATIFGLPDACRREELSKTFTADIENKGNLIVVRIRDSKIILHALLSFQKKLINNGKYLLFYRKYAALRLPTPHQRFFVNYKKGKCTKHFRRSSATLLANSGEGLTDIKRLGGWKSTMVAEGYIEDSI
ncbi:hypothetical protein NQ317_013271 [Molorchus minor]|uniref:Tyr recombinase domain-containing protein n=1 Tax=Molorchus minor TaxID=1323400 RepID=A0ABQ9IS07_9CUCU|nr:hypothetical protein NQ317_013271 [Molorchus minor]